jgi:HlyD family secretion protein
VEQQDLSKLRIDRKPASLGVKRKRWTRPLIYALVIGAIALGALLFYQKSQSVIAVEVTNVVSAYPSQGFTVLNATGYVVAQRKAAVASKATGRLEWLGVAEGSRVKTNEVIARLESNDVNASQEQAAAGVNVARANLEQGMAELRDANAALKRSRELIEKKYISASAHDAVVARAAKAKASIASLKASIVAAQANLNVAKVGVDQTVIRAPFDGVVLTKSANIGDIVTPFSSAVDSKGAVVTMADMSTLEVEADVAESSLAKIRVGMPCEIQLDAIPDGRFVGSIDRTVPTVDRAKATLLVKVKFKDLDPRILPDMSAKVAFLEKELTADEKKPVTAVNPSAIVTRDGQSVVFVIKDDKVAQQTIQRGAALGDLIAISGVAAQTKVVLKPTDNMKNGSQIKLAAK